jgi:DNA-binding CsgD family transcriptional regulator
MELVLKKNWDIPISIPVPNEKEEGVFVGREMEVQLLKNDILRKDQGAILVSGHRGVGKTSLIYKALHEINKELRSVPSSTKKENHPDTNNQGKKKILLVLINAGQFQTESADSAELPMAEKILKTIIRRLYATAKTNYTGNFNYELDLLYKKAISKEYKLQETLLKQMEDISAINKTKEIKFSFKNVERKHILELLLFLSGSLLIVFKPLQKAGLNMFLGLLMAFPLPFLINYAAAVVRSKNKKSTNNKSTELLYQLDNNISNLEHDLEEIHKKLNSEGWKVVYIIDELDKLGNIDNVSKVIKYFKNLFTLSKAIFIFIGNEDIYRSSTIEHDGKNYRPEQYTYFTSKYFISRPTWDELTAFLKNCMKDSVEPKLSKEILRLQHYLAYEAENDFFSLINVMKNHICKYDEDGFPVLVVDMENSDNIKKSRIHKCQEVIFNKKYYVNIPARRYENEQLLRQLIKYTQQIINSPRQTQFDDPVESDNTSSIKRDFNNSLWKLEVFSWTSEEKQIINDVEIPIRKYHYTSYFKNDPPDRFNILSEKENTLVRVSMNYLESLLPVINYYLRTDGIEYSLEQLRKEIENGKDLKSLLRIEWLIVSDSWQSTFQSLIQDSISTTFSRDKIESQIELLTEKTSQISNSLFILLGDLMKQDTTEYFNLSTDPDFWKIRNSKYYTEELKAEKNEILILQKSDSEVEHLIIKSRSPLLSQIQEIPENICYVYIIRLIDDGHATEFSKIKNYKYYQINDIDSLIKQMQLLKAEIYKNANIHSTKNNIPVSLNRYSNNNAVVLNNQETELLKLICTELTLKEIAEKMILSPRTIDGYLDHLNEKLGVNSRVGLMIYAMKNGIVEFVNET